VLSTISEATACRLPQSPALYYLAMPWNPTEPEKNSLRVQIKQRIADAKDDKSANEIIGWLADSSGKKQAEAIVANTTQRKQIQDLHKYGFSKLANNSPQVIQSALKAAPAAIIAAQQAAHAQNLLNSRINGYLASINNKYKNHRSGTLVHVPVNDVVGTKITAVARHYNNCEHRLPNTGRLH
jgi:hypothetical protein